jgi:hypothetical protein
LFGFLGDTINGLYGNRSGSGIRLNFQRWINLGGNYVYTGLNSVFDFALDLLEELHTGIYGPISFMDYLSELGFPKFRAPDSISIDSWERLQQSLKDNNCMVLRLGKSSTIGTQFAIVKSKGRIRDFFLFDEEIFAATAVEYIPKVKVRQLIAYQLLPNLTENSVVKGKLKLMQCLLKWETEWIHYL